MKNALFYFIVFPFYGLIQAIKNYRLSWARNMVWLFVVFYGYTMFRPEFADSTRYVQSLVNMYNNPRTWDAFILSFYSVDEDNQATVDIYQPLMTNFVSLFTDNGNILYAFFGLVYGFFFSRNIWFLIDEFKAQLQSKLVFILLIAFTSVIGFWELNGVRMWTAAQVFFYGAFLFLYQKKSKGIYFILASTLIHFSFFLPIAIFLTYIVFKLPFRVIYIFFVASFFANALNITSVSSFLQGILPEVLLPRVKSYTNEEYVEGYEAFNQRGNWYILYFGKVLNYCIAFLVTVIYFAKNQSYLKDKSFTKFASFAIFLLGIGNLLSSLPSGERYLILAQFFGVAVTVLYFTKFYSLNYKKAVAVVSPFLLFFIIISLRKSFDTISVMTVFTNPILATIIDSPVALIDLIK
jgi:hypothetical protein